MHLEKSFRRTLCRTKILTFNRKKELGGSTTADMGIYAIQLCQWIFQKVPKSVKAIGKLNEDGVDIEMIAELKYGDNKVGRVRSSLITTWPHEATIVGTKGTITVISMNNFIYHSKCC